MQTKPTTSDIAPKPIAAAYTPGPWFADEFNNIYTATVPKDFATGSKPRRKLVAQAQVSFNPAAESVANAKIIAAVPDLVEALRDVVTDIGALAKELRLYPSQGPKVFVRGDVRSIQRELDRYLDKARVALSKAGL